MKRRARRAMILTAALVAVVVGVLVVANWGTVRDHVEAWHFQLTQETVKILPNPASKGVPATVAATYIATWKPSRAPMNVYFSRGFCHLLADYSGRLVIFASKEHDYPFELATQHENVTADVARTILEDNGWRVLEQRFPRRAYVVIRSTEFFPYPDAGEWDTRGTERP
jgi:hypothetical protein